jgi:hypothetical protein
VNILLNNPIAQMYGPYFLIFYGTVISIKAIAANLFLQDKTNNKLKPLSIPQEPNPYEIAYTIAGEKEVLKLIVFSLIQRGYLEVDRQLIQQVRTHGDLVNLDC